MGRGEDGLDEVVDVLLEGSFGGQQPRQVDLGDHLALATFSVFRVDFLRFDQMPQFESVIGIQRFRRRVRGGSAADAADADAAAAAETLRPAQVGERGVARIVAAAVATGSHRGRHRPSRRHGRRRRSVVVPRGPVAVVMMSVAVVTAAVVMRVEVVVSTTGERGRKGAQRSIVSRRQRGKVERLLRHNRQQSAIGNAC